MLQSDAGGTAAVTNLGVTYESSYTSYPWLTREGPMPSGSVQGYNFDEGAADADIPSQSGCTYVGSYLHPPSYFESPNGVWTLFVGDDEPGEDGSLTGWSLHVGTRQKSDGTVRINDPQPPSTSWIERPARTVDLSGSFSRLTDDLPIAAIRWRLALTDSNESYAPISHYAEGAWVPVAPDAQTWALPGVPLHWGLGSLIVDIMDSAGNVRTRPDWVYVRLPQPRYTLAEGATSAFFDTDVTIFNPTDDPAQVRVQFLRKDAGMVVQEYDLAPKGRRRINVKEVPGLDTGQISSIVVPTTVTPLVVERAMFWDERRYGGHAANAVQPSTKWYFAEGAQNGFFHTYLLVANPQPTAISVRLEFHLEGNEGKTPPGRRITVPANTRETIDIGTFPELVGQTFGVELQAFEPFVAERAMYFGNGTSLWEGGHESTGATDTATEWLLAEGATGDFFETYVLVSNPNYSDTVVTMEFLLSNGAIIPKEYPLKGYGRLSVNIEHQHPWLAATSVATRVKSSGGAGIVVERAMYWPGVPGQWTEAHNGFGLTQFATKWGLADGRVGGPLGYATYILLANASNKDASVDVLFVRDTGEQFTLTVTVPKYSRETVDASRDLPSSWVQEGAEFSNVIMVTTPTPIGVERATYWNSTDGVHWAGGANVQATRLP